MVAELVPNGGQRLIGKVALVVRAGALLQRVTEDRNRDRLESALGAGPLLAAGRFLADAAGATCASENIPSLHHRAETAPLLTFA
jgi:hypothetical protein